MDDTLLNLVSALQKYLEWDREYRHIEKNLNPDDAVHYLMMELYGRERPEKLIGGSNAPILCEAADMIANLRNGL